MNRVKRGTVALQRRKKVLSLTSGRIGSNSRLFSKAHEHNIKSLRYAYFSRRLRKRQYRSIWVVRLNSSLSIYGKSYSVFVQHLSQQKYLINRKVVANLALYDPILFQTLVPLSIFNSYIFKIAINTYFYVIDFHISGTSYRNRTYIIRFWKPTFYQLN